MPSQHDSREQPVVNSAEAWHLSRALALGEVMALLRGGTTARTLQALEHEARLAWEAYFVEVGAPESIQTRPESIMARFDADLQLPVVCWPDSEDAMGDRWEFHELPSEGDAPFVLTAPFRPVQLARLPKDSVVVPLNDPRHCAGAALVEALECAGRDAEAAFAASNVDIAWRRLNQVIRIYRDAAKLVYQRVLRADDFNDWTPNLPARITLDRACALICQIGSTARAHEVLAFHVIAYWLQSQADHIEANVPADGRKDAMRESIAQAIEMQRLGVAPFQALALAQRGLDPGSHQVQVVFRPIPAGGPRLVAVPRRNSGNVVTPLRPLQDPA